MFLTDPLTLILILFFSGVLIYKASYFHSKKIFRMSLLQIIYLTIIPGFIFVLIMSHIRTVTSLPPSPYGFISDSLLINLILLSVLYTYGANAIHAVTKQLSATPLRYDSSEPAQINKFFHLTFSHNLMISGAFMITLGMVLLEINHLPPNDPSGLISSVTKGLVLGVLFLLAMMRYTRSQDNYSGRWADLKATFLVGWAALLIIVYSIQKTDASLRSYQLLLPSILGFSVVNTLHLALTFRHIRRRRQNKSALLPHPTN